MMSVRAHVTGKRSSTAAGTRNRPMGKKKKDTSGVYSASASGSNVEEEEASLIQRSSSYIRNNINNYEKEISSRWKVVSSVFENLSLMCWLLIGFLIFSCLIVLVLAEGRNRNNPLVTGVETAIAVRKGDTDPRNYRFSVLENGLQILLISDPNTDKAAAAMDVRVGYFSDPEHIPGLSHLLEHMLFLGTENFPEEDAFDKFLSRNGGASNAYTSKEDTNYHEVLPTALDKSLEMFASFFTAPLTPERIDREKAVDSENEKNLQNDDWRFTQLLRSTSNINHPYHKYGTGNRYTLKDFGKTTAPANSSDSLSHSKNWHQPDLQQSHPSGAMVDEDARRHIGDPKKSAGKAAKKHRNSEHHGAHRMNKHMLLLIDEIEETLNISKHPHNASELVKDQNSKPICAVMVLQIELGIRRRSKGRSGRSPITPKMQPAQSLRALVNTIHPLHRTSYETCYFRARRCSTAGELGETILQRYPKSKGCHTYPHLGLSQAKSKDGERVGYSI